MHHFPLSKQPPQDVSDGGYRIKATKNNLPVLRSMSLYKLVIYPQSVRQPHWHANADELGYCLKGEVLVSFYGNGNERETFLVSSGDVFLIPQGALHSLENIGTDTAELVVQFSSEEPEDFELSSVFNMFSNSVLGNTWGVSADHFEAMRRSTDAVLMTKLHSSSKTSKSDHYVSKYQFSLEANFPLVGNDGGSAKVARQNVWPILKRQAVYSLLLTNKGMREPHWHPETAELGYVNAGKGRMSILSPNGNIDTYVLEEGDIYFIPKAYPHHIENLGSADLRIIIFFDQPMPQDIGFTASVKSNSDEILSAVCRSPKEIFSGLPIYYEDLFIVNKVNPTQHR